VRVVELVSQYGYAVVALLVFAEGLGLPLPGETALLTAGALTAHPYAVQHRLTLVGVILASTIGGIAGGTGGYWLGFRGGAPLLQRYGGLLHISDDHIQHLRQLFATHGFRTVLLSLFLPVLRVIAGWLAGISLMPLGQFELANAIGAFGWSVAIGLVGYFFGNSLPVIEHALGLAGVVILALVLLVGAFFFMRWLRSPARQTSADDTPT